MERLFVAAWPDAATAAALTELPRPDERGVRWVPPEQWHVTLRFLGNCDRDAAIARLAATPLPACEARLGPDVVWLGAQLVVPAAGVEPLAAAVTTATSDLGDPPRPRFRGHLTIARTRSNATSSVLGHPVTSWFPVGEVALVRSELTSDGPRYTTVATFATT